MSTLAAAAKAAAPKLAIHFEGDKEYLKARKWGAHADKHVYYPGAIAYPTDAEEWRRFPGSSRGRMNDQSVRALID